MKTVNLLRCVEFLRSDAVMTHVTLKDCSQISVISPSKIKGRGVSLP